jgi:hypothetical protein
VLERDSALTRFSTNGTERARITSAGLVGIGTSDPADKLEVVGDIRLKPASGANTLINFEYNNGLFAQIRGNGRNGSPLYGDLEFWTRDSTDGAPVERMVVSAAGLVGIGTTSPSGANLVIDTESSGGTGIRLIGRSANDGSKIDFYADNNSTRLGYIECNSTSTTFYSETNVPVRFFQNGGEAFRVDTSKRLLVGTSSAESFPAGGVGRTPRFQVKGDTTDNGSISITRTETMPICFFNAGASGTNVTSVNALGQILFNGYHTSSYYEGASIYAAVDGTPAANSMPTRLVFATTASGASIPTERMRIAQNGHVKCVGFYDNTTASGANMHIESDGDVKRSTSSKKYKTAIEDIENTYSDALLDCRPVWYRSTCTGDNPGHGFWGFIAEEVAEIDPRLVFWKTTEVTYDENGSAVQTPCDPEPEGVAYDRFVPHLLNLIKRQQQAIETLEAANTDLAARLTALEGGTN